MPDGAETSRSLKTDALKIGDWIIEPALNRISRADRTSRIEPKVMAVLLCLADRPGEVVSRDALLAAVWPGVIVGEDSVTQAIIKLRKALGDSTEAPSYIQTIAKSGYRLVASVARPETVSAPVTPEWHPVGSVRVWHRGWLIAAAISALAIACGGIWFVRSDVVDSVEPAASAASARGTQPAISISPFDALGEDEQARLLAQGLTADLTTNLSKIFGLTVVSSASTSVAPAAGARMANASARYVVSGSIQRAGDRLRLYVHLNDVEAGEQLWAQRFDRPVTDLFALQDELIPQILQVLPAKVSEAELKRIAHHHTRNLEAYEHFQRGQMALVVRQQAENEHAREMFRRAIELDPKFARAYAALALTYAADYRNQWTGDGAAALARASELARTAHEIDPEVRETLWVLAFIHLERRRHQEALRYLETAIRLSPSFADGYAFMAGIHVYTGHAANALPLMRTAMRLKPEAGHLYYLILGRAYFALGDFEQAQLNLDYALMRNPLNLEARVYMAAVHVLAGNAAAAQWDAEEIRAVNPRFSTTAWLSTHPLTDRKVHARLVKSLAELGL
jgi:DNA-binding winged helix-turn-helix (wHTH) protein/TolB-like protein/Tfp pilus assembly protein PilF